MLQSKHVYVWHAKWVVGLREQRNIATLIPQFKIKMWSWVKRICESGICKCTGQAQKHLVWEKWQTTFFVGGDCTKGQDIFLDQA